VAEPFGQHVQRDAPHGGVDPEPVAQALGAAVRRVRDARLDHHALDDLPDPHARERPDRSGSLAGRPLGLAQIVCGVQGIEILGRHGDRPVDDLLLAGSILALLEAADRDGTARQIDAGRRDLDQFGRAASGMVQGFAQGAITGGTLARLIEEGRALLGVQIQPVSGIVMEAHSAHI